MQHFLRNFRAVCMAAAVTCPQSLAADPGQLIEQQIAPLVQDGKLAGVAVAVVTPKGTHTAFLGHLDGKEGPPPNADTIFEIASITKTFTATLLTMMVADGAVALDTPVADLLPPEVAMPDWYGRKITLEELSTHMSGLPRLANNFSRGGYDASDPYVHYTVDDLYAFLDGHDLRREPGSKNEYSNLAVALLGHALSLKAGASYEALLRERVFEPLGMADAAFDLSPEQTARLAPPMRLGRAWLLWPQIMPATNWHLGLHNPGGGLRASLADMVRYLEACMHPAGTVLEPVAPLLFTPRAKVGGNMEVALGWHILTPGDDTGPVVWHNGQTGGYCSFIGFNPERGVGVVLLTNTAVSALTDSIGFEMLRALSKADGAEGSEGSNTAE